MMCIFNVLSSFKLPKTFEKTITTSSCVKYNFEHFKTYLSSIVIVLLLATLISEHTLKEVSSPGPFI